MNGRSLSKSLTLLVALAWLAGGEAAWAQLRIVSYNAATDTNPAGDVARTGTSTVLQAIGIESKNGIQRPIDILSLQETTSSLSGASSIVSALNAIYGAGTYARSTVSGPSTDGTTLAVIYNTHSVQLISQTAVGSASTSGAARAPMRYEFRPVGYDSNSDFYLYDSHYKAGTASSDQARRQVEAQTIRADADALGPNARIIYSGDYNIQSSSEGMYQTLMSAGNGKAYDPINTPGTWHNNASLAAAHTQAPQVSAVSGLVGGGMDDRFDFQLVSSAMQSGQGVSYIGPSVPNTLISPTQQSYHAFGNNGTTYNADSNSPSNTALPASEYNPGPGQPSRTDALTALTTASDHLPVVADYQIPAMMNAQVGAAPAQVIVGSSPTVALSVTNSAPVSVAIGADELVYTGAGSGAVSGSTAGTVLALAAADTHNFNLDTSSLGPHSGTVSANSSSQGVAHGTFSQAVNYTVLDHALGAFGSNGADTLTIDFGTLSMGGGQVQQDFQIANLAGLYRAGLDVNGAIESGDVDNRFSLDLLPVSNLAAGAVSGVFHAALALDQPGSFLATYLINVSDYAGIFGGTADTLTLNVVGNVAVPEPATWVLASLGAVALLAARRRRRGQAR